MRFPWTVLASCTIFLAGCAAAPVAKKTPVSAPQPAAAKSTPLHGRVHGGQQPIKGAAVYLFALSTGGYGQASSSLLVNTSGTTGDTQEDGSGRYYVTTNSTGGFTIASQDYGCDSGQQVYLYSVGGDAGFGPNSAAGLMAVLGECGSGNSFSNLPATIQMDEVTTVAAAYALAGYATDATDMSGSNSAVAATGMANAAASALNLVNLGTGFAQTSTQGGNGSVPQAEINTLGDILAACINTDGPGSGGCSTLFSNAENNGNQPSDTATAAINIAHNPGANVPMLYGLATSTAPFQPILSGSSGYDGPNDWTIAITYSGGSLHGPLGLAIDNNGYVWVANAAAFCISQYNSNGVAGPEDGFTGNGSEPSSCGVGITTGGGISNPSYIAFAPSGNIWLANDYDSLTVFDFAPGLGNESFLSADSASPCTGGGLNLPAGIAFDTSGNAWIPDEGYNANSISKFTSCGSGTSFTGGGMDGPSALAIDTSGNIWVANTDGNTVSKFNSSGVAQSSTGYYGVESGTAVAIDSGGNVWVTGRITNSLVKFNSGGTELEYAYDVGGLDYPQGIAIDGVGHVWTANTVNNSIGEFDSSANALSGSNGFEGGLSGPQQLVIDPSGNVWVTNYDNGSGNSLTEFVGAAAPVVTPVVAALQGNQLGARP